MKKALFIGHGYIDITMVADKYPTGNNKLIADDFAISYGGNAVSAAFAMAKLANSAPKDKFPFAHTHLITNLAYDLLGDMLQNLANEKGLSLHPQPVEKSSPSLIFPKDGDRAIIRCRDDIYLPPFPEVNLHDFDTLHVDGHMPHLALPHAKKARENDVLTSLDGGTVRETTEELLRDIDVAVVSELFMEKCGHTKPSQTLNWLKKQGVVIPAVTMGAEGIFFIDETGQEQHLPAIFLPKNKVIDTNGAGDIFHGAYIYSYTVKPTASWLEHFTFARAAATYSIQFLGHLASAPTYQNVASFL